jgi:hypothetical protein
MTATTTRKRPLPSPLPRLVPLDCKNLRRRKPQRALLTFAVWLLWLICLAILLALALLAAFAAGVIFADYLEVLSAA